MFFLFVSCSRHLNTLTKTNKIVIFPSPPDTAKIQFLTSISNSSDVVRKQSKFKKFVLGEETVKPINKPYGIFIRNGKLYICDTYLDGLEIIDLEKNTFSNFIPSGKGQLKLPLNCYVDENNTLYVADGGRRQIVIFDINGNYINCFGEAENFKPTDVFVCKNKIWVSNIKNNKINVYDKDTYKLLNSFPESEVGSNEYLYSPTNIYVTDDKVYVSDFGDFKIKIFTHDGEFVKSIGSYGKNLGQFVRPKGIAVDSELNLYVVDAGFENTQIFNKEGNLLMFFGGPYQGPGYMWLPAKVIVDYDNLKYFQKYVDISFDLKYLIFVSNQYGPDKINVYGAIEPAKSEREVGDSEIKKKGKKKF
ncbi:MAG: 6-bladed beta-propeller [Bacteroidota bacterium]